MPRRCMSPGLSAVLLTVLVLGLARTALPEASVLSWHDGDTLRVVVAGTTETVPLIGIDAPEACPNSAGHSPLI